MIPFGTLNTNTEKTKSSLPTALHSLEDVEYTIHAFSQILVKLKNHEYNRDHLPTV